MHGTSSRVIFLNTNRGILFSSLLFSIFYFYALRYVSTLLFFSNGNQAGVSVICSLCFFTVDQCCDEASKVKIDNIRCITEL